MSSPIPFMVRRARLIRGETQGQFAIHRGVDQATVKSLLACARLQLALAMASERQGFLETATSALARSINVRFWRREPQR